MTVTQVRRAYEALFGEVPGGKNPAEQLDRVFVRMRSRDTKDLMTLISIADNLPAAFPEEARDYANLCSESATAVDIEHADMVKFHKLAAWLRNAATLVNLSREDTPAIK